MTRAYLPSQSSDGEPPNVRAGRRRAEALLALLQLHRVERRQILAALGLDEAGLQNALADGNPTGSRAALINQLHELCRKSFPCFGPFLPENAVAIDLLERLKGLGLRQCRISERLGWSSSHLSRVRDGEHRATEELLDGLEQLLSERLAELLAAALQMETSSVQFVAADQDRAAGLDPAKEADIATEVRSSTLQALVGQPGAGGAALPSGIRAATCHVGPGLWVVALDLNQTGDASGKVLAHEWDALSRLFKDYAKKARQASERPRCDPPSSW